MIKYHKFGHHQTNQEWQRRKFLYHNIEFLSQTLNLYSCMMRSLSRVMMSVLVGYVLRSRYVKILLDLKMKVCQICSTGLWWHVFVAFELPTKCFVSF